MGWTRHLWSTSRLLAVVDWFWRRKRGVQAPRLRTRDDAQPATRIDLKEFAPEPIEFFARAAYIELMVFDELSLAISLTPTTAAKTALATAADAALDRHRAFVRAIEAKGRNAAEEMDRYRAVPDRFRRLTKGADWYETTLTAHLAIGFLDDLFQALAEGLPAASAELVREAFADRSSEAVVAGILAEAMERNPRLPSRLALWGRRVLGDILLVARDVLDVHGVESEGRAEPGFSELIANHTRRMDALGLSA